MNIENITKALQVKLSTATTPTDLLAITKAVQKLRLGAVDTVATYGDMLRLRKSTGDLVFVDGEQKLYFLALGGAWTSILDTALNSAWAWGSNNNDGRLGDNTMVNKSSPVSVVGGFTDWVQVSAGFQHNIGLRSNGTVWAWGFNYSGQLGDGTQTSKSSPVSVLGGFTDWVQVSAGSDHNVGIRSNGTAWAWGVGASGLLGDNTTTNKSSPVSVVGGFTDWVQFDAGTGHTVGIRANGTAWAWGLGSNGRLGDNTTVSKRSPVSVVGGFTDWMQVSAGFNHSVGVRDNGTAWAWGSGDTGRLGNNSTLTRSSPVSVVGGFTNWVQVSAGQNHSAGVRSDGTAWAWGAAANGRLGDNTTVSKSSPVAVVGGFTDWVQVSAGGRHTVGLRANGSVWAWGYGFSGQIGNNSTVSRLSPVSVVGGFTDWVQISAGYDHSTALR
jgi:alpha-tubulin suppressor-like RCC1 family protein